MILLNKTFLQKDLEIPQIVEKNHEKIKSSPKNRKLNVKKKRRVFLFIKVWDLIYDINTWRILKNIINFGRLIHIDKFRVYRFANKFL